MQASEDQLQLLSEKRKWQSEMENKRRQLEDDRRELQHMKLKALREQWLLDGAPPAGTADDARTRNLEETINRLENELLHLETGCVWSGSRPAVEVKGINFEDDGELPEVKVHKSVLMAPPREAEQLKRAMYSVEITVERDRVTGETKVLSSNTKLPVDLSQQGVIVYEDERKVVHEMNGEDGVQPLSSSEVEELIHKADEALMMSQTHAVVTSLQSVEVEEEVAPQAVPLAPVGASRPGASRPGVSRSGVSRPGVSRPGASAELELSAAGASEQKPVTMVFMGYQNVEDEDQTKKVLGLQEMAKAELVLITDSTTSPDEGKEEVSLLTPPPKPQQAEVPSEALVEPEQLRAGAAEPKKEKQLCVCCSIM